MERLSMMFVYAAALAIAFWLIVVLPYQMAQRRRRRAWIYVLLSLLVSPLIVVPVLWVIGSVPRYGTIGR